MPKIRQSTTQINFKPAINIGRIYIPAGGGGGATIGGFVAQITGTAVPVLGQLTVIGTSAYVYGSQTTITGSSGYIIKLSGIDTSTPTVVARSGAGSAETRQILQKRSDGNLIAFVSDSATNHRTQSFSATDVTTITPSAGNWAWNANVYTDVMGMLQTPDNVMWIIGDDGTGSFYRTIVGKTDSSGNAIGAYSFGPASADKTFCSVTYDSSYNPIIVQGTFATENTEVIKISNASFPTIIWDSLLSVSLYSSTSFTLSNNTYVAGRNTNSDFLVIKLDNNGAVVWSYKITGFSAEAANNVSVYAETVSTVTSVYISGKTGTGLLVAKYTDNGSTATQNWNNSFVPATGNFISNNDLNGTPRANITISGNNTAYVYILAAYQFTTRDPLIIKIPTSGAVPSSGIVVSGVTFNYTANAVSTVSAGVTKSTGAATSQLFLTVGGTRNINNGTYNTASITPTNTTF